MKNTTLLATLLALPLCAAHAADPAPAAEPLAIARQGVFSSGGRVTDPVPGDYDPTMNWLDPERRGTTAHVDHANTFFQIPADAAGAPVVFLHGYGQTRTGWQSTPDGRPGWADFFLRAGHPVFLVDQPRRGAAGATERVVTDPGDVADGRFKAGEQAWYTHFRIGRVAPDRYEGSQFPEGAEALEQFFCQMTPSTGNYDEALFGTALGAVLADARRMTGRKAVYVTHSQGGRVGWATPAEDVAAIVAVEPGFAPEPGSDRYRKFLDAKVPMLFLFGDNIENGPEDVRSTGFWRSVLAQCRDFAERYRADGGDATVVHLPDLGIRGNSHFLFQERNSDALAALVENWLRDRGLATRQPQTRALTMKKNILILSASPRKGGNSDLLCDQFAKGATEAGHDVEKIRLAERKIGYCLGCYACRKLHKCFQKDDANELVEKMLAADSIVLATPVYFYSMDAQPKALIDRTVSRWDDFGRFAGTEFWLILTAADEDHAMMEPTLAGLRGFMRDCMDGSIERGVLYGTGAYEKGAVKTLPVFQEAYEAGKTA